MPASNQINHFSLGNSPNGANPTWGNYETMPINRILHDAVQLPNGQVLIINGAQVMLMTAITINKVGKLMAGPDHLRWALRRCGNSRRT